MAASSIVFVRRQSPDWQSLSRDYQRGKSIDPRRYMPSPRIRGLPETIPFLIHQWNARFKIDFFTFRKVLADLSRENIAVAQRSRAFDCNQLAEVSALAATEDFYVYFHDDDDFFAPYLANVTVACNMRPDAIVTPLFRVGAETYTFARKDCTPEFIWGWLKPHEFRFQTNNYGISSRRCATPAQLSAFKDHVLASRHADQAGYRDEVLPTIVSATVKTPGSASLLPALRNEETLRRSFELFIERLSAPELPEAYRWIASPLRGIVWVVESVYRGKGYDAIADVLSDQTI